MNSTPVSPTVEVVADYQAHIAAHGKCRTLLITGGAGAGKTTIAHQIAPAAEVITGRLTDAAWRKYATSGMPVRVLDADDITGLTIRQIIDASQPGRVWRTLGRSTTKPLTASAVIIIARSPIELDYAATTRTDHLHLDPTGGDTYTPATHG